MGGYPAAGREHFSYWVRLATVLAGIDAGGYKMWPLYLLAGFTTGIILVASPTQAQFMVDHEQSGFRMRGLHGSGAQIKRSSSRIARQQVFFVRY